MVKTQSIYILLKTISNQDLIEDIMVVGAYSTRESAEEEQKRREYKDQIEGVEGIKYHIQITVFFNKEKQEKNNNGNN